MLELLAPAGSMEALRAAVQNGADAVYLGCGQFNARQGAQNFTPQELTEAVKYCHVRGVAVHLAVNTLVSDLEMAEAANLIRHAAASGVDAFIVQDLGIIRLCRQIAPDIPLHGSTQMTVHSLSGARLCAAWGLKRVVLSRELSREEIRYIIANCPIEVEVFGHGALCMCYSGQCYLSAAIGGRSGNRGRCAQPCRQTYGYSRWQARYPLSLKDNCLIRHLADLEQMGVASLKLEGRMKRPEYVAAVTGVYRKALDGEPVDAGMVRTLTEAFNRQGFTDGYFAGNIGSQMFGVRQDTPESDGFLQKMRRTYDAVENPLVPVAFRVTVTAFSFSLTVTDEDGHQCTVEGAPPEQARSAELTQDALVSRLRKTGGTPYYCTDVQVTLSPGVMLSAAAINAVRRDALHMLTAQRARREVPAAGRMQSPGKFPGNRHAPGLTVQVTTREQITPKLLKMPLAALYVPVHILDSDPALCAALAQQVPVCAVLPRITHDGDLHTLMPVMLRLKSAGVTQALAGNIGQLLPLREWGFETRGDFGLNIFNSHALAAVREMELSSVTLSFEMTMPQIRDVSKAVPCEILAYGRLPLMVTENCIIKGNTGACSCQSGNTKLIDKTGAEFPVIRDGNTCRSVLLNGKKLYWLDRKNDLARLGLWAIRLQFTTENPREVDQVLDWYRTGGEFLPGGYTRGLYLRGLN